MAKNLMHGPLKTKPGKSLGGEDVHGVPETKKIPDPLGHVKAKGAKGAENYGK